MGSPPPTRGTRQFSSVRIFRYRITPAYAGNTVTAGRVFQRLKDHPRLRGEHSFLKVKMMSSMGSPPPTRGTPDFNCGQLYYTRITPAYAGNTIEINWNLMLV